jgi:hypothetical protein
MHYTKNIQTATVLINNWEEARYVSKCLRRWLFRGQNKSEWLLKTTLERSLESRSINNKRRTAFELMVLSDFQSVAHNFIKNVPNIEDTIAWLSLIQHHGGPTRLLDFTESFYIAAYFALDGASKDSVIWAINRPELIKILPNTINLLSDKLEIISNNIHDKLKEILVRSISGDVPDKIVITAAPSRRSERQFIQKRLAVIPLNLEEGFMGALLGSFTPVGQMPNENNMKEAPLTEMTNILEGIKILKIVLLHECLLDARMDLNAMNINAFTLFRDLDGLGKQLSDRLNSVEAFENDQRTILGINPNFD